MTQYGEGTATQNIYNEKPKEKKEINVRLSLFFDGTLNNRVNIEEREKAKLNNLIASPYYSHKTDDGNNSYDNGRTNIAIMEPHLLDTSKGYDLALKEYIEGQGTFNLEGDSTIGYVMGGLSSGVAGRAVQGIECGLLLIIKNIKSSKYCIKKLTIDVFGFSRGAATARYAIHLLLKGSAKLSNEYSDSYMQETPPLIENIANHGVEIHENAVEILFAGLYDTVLSYYGSQKLKFKWLGNVLQQNAIKHAKKALHLAAADEHRQDFPLHNIKSAGSKGEEYYLPGVHSDVGGSYNTASDLAIEAEIDPDKKVYMLSTNEKELIILKSIKKNKLKKDREKLIKQAWYNEDQIKINSQYHGRSSSHQLIVNRESISSAYCNIPLKVMAKYSRDENVNLELNVKLDRRANIILKPYDELSDLENKIHQYISEKKGNGLSKAEDWLSENSSWNKFIITNKIRNKHFNFSAHPGWGYSPRIKNGNRTRYVYKA